MIYSVVPRALEGELFERLAAYYRDDPGVEVIVDRRSGPDRRRPGGRGPRGERREMRDRRRRGASGTFPSTDVPG